MIIQKVKKFLDSVVVDYKVCPSLSASRRASSSFSSSHSCN